MALCCISPWSSQAGSGGAAHASGVRSRACDAGCRVRTCLQVTLGRNHVRRVCQTCLHQNLRGPGWCRTISFATTPQRTVARLLPAALYNTIRYDNTRTTKLRIWYRLLEWQMLQGLTFCQPAVLPHTILTCRTVSHAIRIRNPDLCAVQARPLNPYALAGVISCASGVCEREREVSPTS